LDLLQGLGSAAWPPFPLAKFEGDAAFLWVEDGRAEGSLLLDAIPGAGSSAIAWPRSSDFA
jgi:hypothetical protein